MANNSVSQTGTIKLNFLIEDIPWQHGQDLFALWQSMRHGRRWPARTDIHPHDMKPYLKDIMLIDVHTKPLGFEVRLAGTEYNRFLPSDPTGLRLAELPNGASIAHRFQQIHTLAQPYMALDTAILWSDIDFRHTNMLVLPLGAGTNVDTLMVLTDYF